MHLHRGVIPTLAVCLLAACVSYFCALAKRCCVGPQRDLSCVEGDLAAVELNIESVVLLLVCVIMMMIIIMTTIIMSSPVQGSI